MPTRGRPQATETRDAIVRAGMEAIARDGLAALRIRRVAGDAGVSHATLLHHFPSKEELLAAVLEALERELAPAGSPPGTASALDRLVAEFDDAARRLTGPSREFAVGVELLAAAPHSSRVALLTKRLLGSWRAEIEQAVASAQVAGLCRNDVRPAVVADVVIAQLVGVALIAFAHGWDVPTDIVVRAALDAVLCFIST